MTMKLNEAFDDWTTSGGIFAVLQTLPVPWQSESIAQNLDFIFHGNRSGGKFVSPLVNSFADGEALTPTSKTALATAILNVFSVSWSKIYNTMSAQYNPIENYDMTEQMTNDTTTEQHGKTTTRTDNLTNNTGNEIYGFNSQNPVPTGKQEDKATGTQTLADSGTDTHTRNYKLTRSGNIGVTTSQQMLQSERDLWLWSFFFDVVFPDLDRVLTLPIY